MTALNGGIFTAALDFLGRLIAYFICNPITNTGYQFVLIK